MEKYEISLEEARSTLDSANRMITLTLPVLRDNKFLVKIFEKIHDSMLSIVKSVLQHEYLYKRINLYQDAESNFDTFRECAERYKIPSDYANQIRKVFLLMKSHKESPVEFVKKEKFVILSDNLRTDIITIAKLKEFHAIALDVLSRTKVIFDKEI